MRPSHLIPVLEQLPTAGIVGDQTPDFAVGIPVQKIERAQVRLHRSQPAQSLLSWTASRPLVRQDDPLRPIGQAYPGQHPGSANRGALQIEPVMMKVDHGCRVPTQCPLLEPGVIAAFGQIVIVASGPKVNTLNVANAELGANPGLCDNVVGRSDERPYRAASVAVEADAAHRSDVSHEAQSPMCGRWRSKKVIPFGPSHACLTCYRGPGARARCSREHGH